MISKELLSEVLELKINLVEIDEARNKVFYYCNQFGRMTGEISTFELAHKCKEWANKCGINGKNYQLETALLPECLCGAYCNIWSGAYKQNEEEIISNTEPEAIFKACEYIMEQTKCGS